MEAGKLFKATNNQIIRPDAPRYSKDTITMLHPIR